MSNFTLSLKLEAFDRISRPLRGIAATARNFSNGVSRSFNNVRQSVNRTSEAMSGVTKAGRNLRNVGLGISLGISAPAILAGRAIIQTSADFEAAMLNVQALTGATGEDFERLQRQARDLGETTVFSATQAADAQAFLAQSGQNTNEIISAMPGILNLASAANLDIATTADLATNVMAAYGLQSENTSRVSDILSQATRNSNTNLTEQADAMREFAPIAIKLGIDIEETAAMIGVLGNNGIKGAMAGTALRGSISRLINPVGETRQRLRDLNIQYNDLFNDDETMISLANTMQVLEDRGASLSDLMIIFGQEAGPKFTAALNGGSEALVELTATIEDSAGAAQEMADIKMSGATGDMKRFASAFEAVRISLGESGGLGFFQSVTRFFTGMLSAFSRAPEPILKVVNVLILIAAVIGPLIVALGVIGISVGPVATGFMLLIAPFRLLIGLLPLLASGFRILTLAVMMNPVALIVLGIVAAVAALAAIGYLLIRNWDSVKSFFARLWQNILEFFSNPIQAITTLLMAFNPVSLIIRGINSLVNFLFGIDLLAAGRAMIGGFADGIAERWHSLVQWLSSRISALVDFMPDWVKDRLGIGSIHIEPPPPPSDGFPPPNIPRRSAVPNTAALQEQQIRNRIDLHVTADGQVRMRELTTGSRNTDINVDTGPLMVGGLN